MITFKVLQEDEIKILKKINIVSNNDMIIGFILYERKFSDNYKFKEINDDEKDFSYYISYPKQEYFPEDEIDKVIINTIKEDYPNSFVHNQLIFTSTDIENLNRMTKRPYEMVSIIIRPDLYGQQFEKLYGMELEAFKKDIKIYVNSSQKLIKDIYSFYGVCNFDKHKEIFKNLDKIKFL